MKIVIYNNQRDLLIYRNNLKNRKFGKEAPQNFDAHFSSGRSISLPEIEKLVFLVLKRLKATCDEVILHFVTKKKISEIHKIYFNDPTPTDCISFPIDSPSSKIKGYKVLGEVFVCPKVAMEYSQSHQIDCCEELGRYIIHGLLHLVGYDDLAEAQQKKMRQMENRLLNAWIKLIEIEKNN